jgi:acyl-CoA thioesterase
MAAEPADMAADELEPASFADEVRVEPDPEAPGRYRGLLSGNWNAPIIPHGGVVTAYALAAMTDALAVPEQPLRSVSVAFAAQVVPGPVEVDVQVLRRGRSLSQVSATLRNEGADAGHTSIAVFGDRRPGFEFTDLSMPEVPPPDACPSFREYMRQNPPEENFFSTATFWQNAENRAGVDFVPWVDGWDPVSSERSFWVRFDVTPRRADGTVDPLALVAMCDVMPGAVGQRMGPDCPMYYGPSADLTVHVLGEAVSDWWIGRNRCRHAGDGYASLELELWDPKTGLVAYATQMMFFMWPEGPPPDDKLHPPS